MHITKRFRHVLNETINDIFILATFLDCQFAHMSFVEEEAARSRLLIRAKELVVRYSHQNEVLTIPPDSGLDTRVGNNASFMGRLFSTPSGQIVTTTTE